MDDFVTSFDGKLSDSQWIELRSKREEWTMELQNPDFCALDFIKKKISWTLKGWISCFRPYLCIYNWEGLSEIPSEFMIGLKEMGFHVIIYFPYSSCLSHLHDLTKPKIKYQWLQWLLEINREPKQEYWIMFYHGGKLDDYLGELMDFPFLLQECQVWRTSFKSICMIHLESHYISSFVQYFHNHHIDVPLFASIEHFVHYYGEPSCVRDVSRLLREREVRYLPHCVIGMIWDWDHKDVWISSLQKLIPNLILFPTNEIHSQKLFQHYIQQIQHKYRYRAWDYEMHMHILYVALFDFLLKKKEHLPMVCILHQHIRFKDDSFPFINYLSQEIWDGHIGTSWSAQEWRTQEHHLGMTFAYRSCYSTYVERLHHETTLWTSSLSILDLSDLKTSRMESPLFYYDIPSTTSRYSIFTKLHLSPTKVLSVDISSHLYHPEKKDLAAITLPNVYVINCPNSESWKKMVSPMTIHIVEYPHGFTFPEWNHLQALSDERPYLLYLLMAYAFPGIFILDQTTYPFEQYSTSPSIPWNTIQCLSSSSSISSGGGGKVIEIPMDITMTVFQQSNNPIIGRMLQFISHRVHEIDYYCSTKEQILYLMIYFLQMEKHPLYFLKLQPRMVPMKQFPYIYPVKWDSLQRLDIAMLVKNNQPYLDDYFWKQITRIQSQFPFSLRFFFYENNSTDQTVQSILSKQDTFDIILFQQDLGSYMNIDRIYRLGKIRNFFIKKIADFYIDRSDIEKNPYILFMDTDVTFHLHTFKTLLHEMSSHPDAVMIGANILALDDVYYDMLALNHGSFYLTNNRRGIQQVMYESPINASSSTMKVDTCFGGMTLLYRELLFFIKYGDCENTLSGISTRIKCEHYLFCKQLKRWGTVYIAKNATGYWIIDWKREHHLILAKSGFVP